MPSPTSALPKILPACTGLDIDSRALGELVDADPALAQRLERYVTTYYARFDGRIVGGSRALSVAGPQVGALVAWVHALITDAERTVPRRIASLLWTDAVTRGVAARLLAQVDHSAPPDQAFALGFAWSLATFGLLKGDADRQLRWWRDVRRRPAGSERQSVQVKLLGDEPHLNLSRTVADWGLPSDLLDVLAAPANEVVPAHARPLRSLIERADALTCAMSAAGSGAALNEWIRRTTKELGISAAGAWKLTEEVIDTTPAVAEALGLSIRRWAPLERLLLRRGEPGVVSEANELAILVELQRELIRSARARVTDIENELEFRSRVDSVTDLLTLQAFCARLRVQMGEGSAQLGALVAIDIEEFGGLVARFGLVQTDQLLARVAQTLDRVFRDATLMTRCGPATFVIALPTYGRRARVMAERGREAVEQLSVRNGSTDHRLYVRSATLNLDDTDLSTRPEAMVELVRRRVCSGAHQADDELRRAR